MKLFILSHTFSGDGSSQVLLETCDYLIREHGWLIDAIVPPNLSFESSQALSWAGVDAKPRGNFLDYDLGIVNCLTNAFYLDQIPASMPTILWAHEAETVLKTMRIEGEEWRRWFKKASHIIFQTPWQSMVFSDYIDLLNGNNIHILPNPVSLSIASGQDTLRLRNSVYIVSVGKITPLKRQQDLIDAVICLADDYPVHCNFIGGMEYIETIPSISRDLLIKYSHLFTLSGELPRLETHQRISVADIFCFPSISESFGLAPLEAGMLNKPVILRNLEVYQYIGWKHGENCLLFDDLETRDLKGCIETLILDKELGKKIAAGGQNLAMHLSNESTHFFNKFANLCLKVSQY